MALTAYLNATQRLLQNPPAPTTLYAATDLTAYINIARGQLAGEGKCIRVIGTLDLIAGARIYPFSAIDVSAAAGVEGVLHVRQASYAAGQGYKLIRPRSFEWFWSYKLNNPVPPKGAPMVWSQYGQGAASGVTPTGITTQGGGSLYIDPLPNVAYTLLVDCVCFPSIIEQDTDPEAIPYTWTDAVPFFAAYYALLASQISARQADADRMLARYGEFMQRARAAATPDVQPYIYPQQHAPVRAGQFGQQQQRGAGGGGGG